MSLGRVIPSQLIVAATAVMTTGAFAIAPFLVVYMTNRLHYSPTQVAVVLTASLVAARLFPLAGGLLADRLQHRDTLLLGLILRSTGFLCYAVSTNFAWFVLCAILVGLGGAIYDPSAKAIIAGQPEALRKRTFTFLNQALNLGALLGPALGAYLLTRDPRMPFVVGGSLYALMAGLLWLNRRHFESAPPRTALLKTLHEVSHNVTFLRFTAIMTLFYFMFAQLTLALPIKAAQLGGSAVSAGTVLFVNGLVGLVAMFALRPLFEHHPATRLVRAGVLITALGLVLVPVVPALWWLMVCVVLYTIGETLVLPSVALSVAAFSQRRHASAYFGAFDLSWAVGGTLGNFAGAMLMAQSTSTHLPWVIFASAGLLATVLLKTVHEPHP